MRLFTHAQINRLLMTMFIFLTTLPIQAQTADSDSVRFSLLTCSPGEKIYTLFGHTAIRYENPVKHIDVVFNYGIFSFDAPNFIWRFVKGEADYAFGANSFTGFVAEYSYFNRAVWQQTLNLTAKEKAHLLELLETNYLPQNRIYRYSYFYDNCSTRPRDRIEESVDGTIVYKATDYRQSFRDIVHESSENSLWNRFGMDLCLGVKADRPITFREEMFHPFYLMNAFRDAHITDKEGNNRPLVKSTTEILSKQEAEETDQPFFTPLVSAILLLLVIALITLYGLKTNRSFWGVDVILFISAGMVGCVIAFLMCCSIHPAVSPNYLIFVFHPLHLLLLPFIIHKKVKPRKSIYHIANLAVLTLFIVIWPINPQHFNIAVLPLALCLWIRSASYTYLAYKKK